MFPEEYLVIMIWISSEDICQWWQGLRGQTQLPVWWSHKSKRDHVWWRLDLDCQTGAGGDDCNNELKLQSDKDSWNRDCCNFWYSRKNERTLMAQMEVCIWRIEIAASVDVCICIRGIYTKDPWNRVCCTFWCFQRSIWWQWLESPVKKYVSGGKDFWNRRSCHFDGRIRTRWTTFGKDWTWIANQETVAMIAIMSWNFKATRTPGIYTAAAFDIRVTTREYWWYKWKSAFGE